MIAHQKAKSNPEMSLFHAKMRLKIVPQKKKKTLWLLFTDGVQLPQG